jgi:abequosyltransferase
MSLVLSICIPTFNRGAYLICLLDSLFSQDSENEVEVIISDNASTDTTKEIVLGYQKRHPNIHYFQWDRNMGADMNYLKVVELAHGEYCWFMGSDDALKPRALERVQKELKSACDIYLCNRVECDIHLNPLKERLWLSNRIGDREFRLSEKAEQIEYFRASQSLGALFSYLSSMIFRREKWNAIVYDKKFTGTAYSHTFMLLSFLDNPPCTLQYIKDTLVLCRGENDSFMEEGILKRFLLDFEGFLLLAENCFHEDKEVKQEFLNVMTREHKWYPDLIRLRSLGLNWDRGAWNDIENKLREFGYPPWTLFIIRELELIRKPFMAAIYWKRRLKEVKQFVLQKMAGK